MKTLIRMTVRGCLGLACAIAFMARLHAQVDDTPVMSITAGFDFDHATQHGVPAFGRADMRHWNTLTNTFDLDTELSDGDHPDLESALLGGGQVLAFSDATDVVWSQGTIRDVFFFLSRESDQSGGGGNAVTVAHYRAGPTGMSPVGISSFGTIGDPGTDVDSLAFGQGADLPRCFVLDAQACSGLSVGGNPVTPLDVLRLQGGILTVEFRFAVDVLAGVNPSSDLRIEALAIDQINEALAFRVASPGGQGAAGVTLAADPSIPINTTSLFVVPMPGTTSQVPPHEAVRLEDLTSGAPLTVNTSRINAVCSYDPAISPITDLPTGQTLYETESSAGLLSGGAPSWSELQLLRVDGFGGAGGRVFVNDGFVASLEPMPSAATVLSGFLGSHAGPLTASVMAPNTAILGDPYLFPLPGSPLFTPGVNATYSMMPGNSLSFAPLPPWVKEVSLVAVLAAMEVSTGTIDFVSTNMLTVTDVQ